MRKLFTSLLVLSCMTIGVFALESDTEASIDLVSPQTAAIAYMDTQDATPAMQEKILEARNEIIFHNSWVVDGYRATYTTPDGTVEDVPLFSSLFPGWDVPCTPAKPATVGDIMPIAPSIVPLASSWEYNNYPHYLEAANSSNANQFAQISSLPGREAKTTVYSLSSAQTCNVGYSDRFGNNLGFHEYMTLGSTFSIYDLRKGQFLGVRASTHSTPSWATLRVGILHEQLELR